MGDSRSDDFAEFEAWTTQALASAPPRVAAFCFNLYEHESQYAIQIVAARTFSPADPAWAVDPIFFTPEDYLFPLAKEPAEEDWRRALSTAIELVTRYLDQGAKRSLLRESEGLACGFVDGDLHVIRPVT